MEKAIPPESNPHDFVPCLRFVPRGVTKTRPDKIALTQEELALIIAAREEDLADVTDDDEVMDTGRQRRAATTSVADFRPNNPADEYNFGAYDEEDTTQFASLAHIAVVDGNQLLDDEEDSETEDDNIKPGDNLLLVGRVYHDQATLEVHVYNEQEGSFFVHHDILLPSFPLCIEWMRHDPESQDPGNMCAIGAMDPVITVWDLDILDTLEPALKLGNRKRGASKIGHKDAVLDLSWNTNFPHILASCSVDETVILWDLDEKKPHTKITAFNEKVQSIQFCPTEAPLLLAGSCDGTVKLFDCRNPETVNTDVKVWTYDEHEIERVLWNTGDSNYFWVGTNKGQLNYCDIRQEGQTVWSVEAHSDEISSILQHHSKGNMLITTSADSYMKVWKFDASSVTLVYEEDIRLGRVQCGDVCPENGFTVAVGGDHRRDVLRVIDMLKFDSVKRTFQD